MFSVGGVVLCFLKGVFRLHGQDRVSKAVMVSKPEAYDLFAAAQRCYGTEREVNEYRTEAEEGE